MNPSILFIVIVATFSSLHCCLTFHNVNRYTLHKQNVEEAHKKATTEKRDGVNDGIETTPSSPPPIVKSPALNLQDHRVDLVQELIFKLIRNYNKEAVLDRPIVIHMDVLLLQVKNTIEKEGTLESVIALMIEWHDRRMIWEPSDFANLTFLSLSTDQVWLPDIAMTNAADHLYKISRDSRFTVRVSYDGLFRFVPTGTAKTWCDLKLINFPFDIQECSLEFESWSLDSTTMTFDGNSDLLIDESFSSTQFYLCEHNALTYHHTYDFTGETFTRVRFIFIVKRKSSFYVINLIFPITILSFIQTLSFLIPSRGTNADRIAFGTTNMLTLVVYQTIITEQLPKTSDAVTSLSKYVITLIVTAAIGIVESVLVERFQSRMLRSPPFYIMRVLRRVPILMREPPIRRQRRLSLIPSSILPIDETCESLAVEAEPEETERPFKQNGSQEIEEVEGEVEDKQPVLPSAKLTIIPYESCNRNLLQSSETVETLHVCQGLVSKEVKSGSTRRMSSISKVNKKRTLPAVLRSPIARRLLGKSKPPPESKFREGTRSRAPSKHTWNNKRTGSDDSDEYYRKWVCTEPSDLWAELSYKLDSLTFLLCIITAFSAPIIMFLPPFISAQVSRTCHR